MTGLYDPEGSCRGHQAGQAEGICGEGLDPTNSKELSCEINYL